MSDLDKNMAVKSMVVMRKAFRTIDAKVSETFKEFNLTPDRKSTRLNSSHIPLSRMPSSA